MEIINAIEKTLRRNDTGETGSHQSGISIPKKTEILSFFPELDRKIKNDNILISFKDSSGKIWEFKFIYYNNKFHDEGGTRNEYRLTRTTGFIKNYALKEGDKITLSRYADNQYSIGFTENKSSPETPEDILILGNSWRTVRI